MYNKISDKSTAGINQHIHKRGDWMQCSMNRGCFTLSNVFYKVVSQNMYNWLVAYPEIIRSCKYIRVPIIKASLTESRVAVGLLQTPCDVLLITFIIITTNFQISFTYRYDSSYRVTRLSLIHI